MVVEGEKGQVTSNNNNKHPNKDDTGGTERRLRSFLEEYYVKTTNIPREYLMGAYYTILSYAIGDLYSIVVPTTITGEDPVRTNLWIVFTGASGEGKSQTIDIIKKNLRSIEILSSIAKKILDKIYDNQKPSKLSAEEIKDIINQAKERFLSMRLVLGSREGFARHISENQQKTNGKFIIELDEIRSILQGKKGYLEELMDLLLTIFMGNSYKLTYSKGREYLIRKPNYICLVGGAQTIEENFDLYLFDRGFYRRAIIIYGERQKKEIIPQLDLEALKKLVAFITGIAIYRAIVMKIWEEAKKQHIELRKYHAIPLTVNQNTRPYKHIIKYIEELQEEKSRIDDPKLRNLLEANSVHVLRLWILNALVTGFPNLHEIIDSTMKALDNSIGKLEEKFKNRPTRADEILKEQFTEEYIRNRLKDFLEGRIGEKEIKILEEMIVKAYQNSIKPTIERVERGIELLGEADSKIKYIVLLASMKIDLETNEDVAKETIEDMKTIYRREKDLLEKVFEKAEEEDLIIDKVKDKIMRLIRQSKIGGNGATVFKQGIFISDIYRHFSGKNRKYVKNALKRLWEEDKIMFFKMMDGRTGRTKIIVLPTDIDDLVPSSGIMDDKEVFTYLNR